MNLTINATRCRTCHSYKKPRKPCKRCELNKIHSQCGLCGKIKCKEHGTAFWYDKPKKPAKKKANPEDFKNFIDRQICEKCGVLHLLYDGEIECGCPKKPKLSKKPTKNPAYNGAQLGLRPAKLSKKPTLDEFIQSPEFKRESKRCEEYIKKMEWAYQDGVQDERGRNREVAECLAALITVLEVGIDDPRNCLSKKCLKKLNRFISDNS